MVMGVMIVMMITLEFLDRAIYFGYPQLSTLAYLLLGILLV